MRKLSTVTTYWLLSFFMQEKYEKRQLLFPNQGTKKKQQAKEGAR